MKREYLHSTSHASNKNKRHQIAKPSKVLHVRGLPMHTTENELAEIVKRFGKVQQIFLLASKSQAFIQMQSIDVAQKVLASFEDSEPSIRSKSIFLQFSSRQEIEIRKQNNGYPQASSILLITITNLNYKRPTLENIHQICKQHGEVLKIIMLRRKQEKSNLQALVQMATVDAAIRAKLHLEGKDVFQGCCRMRVGYSTKTNLVVKQSEFNKSRDFTVASNKKKSEKKLAFTFSVPSSESTIMVGQLHSPLQRRSVSPNQYKSQLHHQYLNRHLQDPLQSQQYLQPQQHSQAAQQLLQHVLQYQQPQYSQPQYSQPQYSQPQYSQPQYPQPKYP